MPDLDDARSRRPPRHRKAVLALSLLPKNLVSRVAGRLAGVPVPRPARSWLARGFGRLAGVDFDEVRDPLHSFPSLQDFFVRALVEGARPVDPAPDALVSPCDGAWGCSGTVHEGQLLQVKGRPYGVAELLASDDEALVFEGGAFATLYLSPRDYHRFHVPATSSVAVARHVPGGLWPVNRIGVEGVERLFARNERIVAHFDLEGGGRICLVAVGATMVGKVEVVFDDLETNVPGVGPEPRERRYDPPKNFVKGDEWGRFKFGSTLVLLATPDAVALDAAPPGTPVRLGQRIGTVLDRGRSLDADQMKSSAQ